MKKIIILLIIGLFILTTNVKALSVKPSGLTGIGPGQTKNVNIIVEGASSSTKVSAVDGTLVYDTNVLTLNSATKIIGWSEFSTMNNFAVGDITFSNLISSSPVTLYTLSFTAKSTAPAGNTTISINNPTCTDESGNAIAGVTGGSITVRVQSTVNTLSSLSISGGTISFNASTTSYNVTIDSASATISATATDSAATVAGTGSKTLNYGANAFNIVVTSEAGTTKTYTINVTRPDNRSTNNNLSSLTVSSGTINFNAATTSYTLTVGKDITSMTVGASLADSKASFVSGYGPRTVNLNVGNNDILIKVNNEKGETKTYTLKVTKEDPRSAVNTLKTLTISSGTLNFQKDILEYKTTVPYNITKMDVTYEASDPKAKVEVTGNDNFIVGDNTILIKVTAENETVKEYKIIVTRQEEGAATLSNNSYLKSLSVGGYNLNFNKKTLEYNLTIKKEKALDITALPEEKTSKVKIIDNTDLSNGSVIRIIVTSEEGSSREYQINIKVQDNLTLFIYIGIGSLVLVLIIILIIVKAHKKKKSLTTPITYPRPVGLSTNNQFNNPAPINQTPTPIVNPNINLEHTLEFPVNKINHDDEEII